jgi:hypothetical protein
MNILTIVLFIGALGIGSGDRGPGRQAAAASGGPGSAEQIEIETFLRGAKIVSVEKGVATGRGAAWRVTLRDAAGSRRGFFKYINARRPQIAPMSYKYEVAAYALSKLVGTPIVPPVIEREVEGRKGSLQIFLETCISEIERRKSGQPAAGGPQALADAFDELTLFEGLTACERDVNDILIHRDSGRLCRVDFAEAFDPRPALSPAAAAAGRCSRRLFAGLRDFDPAAAETALKPYLNAAEIRGVLARRTLLLDKFTALIQAKGEAAILFELAVPEAPVKKRP